ncbi:MAG: hypothetical protein KAJ03_11275 [Gammaproteobacteria bacterium]|nr:hypothetical protein [Gammaproteobacteria bacterium]
MNAKEKNRWDKCKHDCTTPFIHGTDNKDYGKPACDINCPDYGADDHAQAPLAKAAEPELMANKNKTTSSSV